MKTYLKILFILLIFINFSCSRDPSSEIPNEKNQVEIKENKLNIKDSTSFEENKDKIDSSTQPLQTNKSLDSNSAPNSYTSKYNFWMFGFLISIVIIFILLWFLIKKHFENENLYVRKKHYKEEYNKKFGEYIALQNEKSELQNKYEKEKKIHQSKNDLKEITQAKKLGDEDEKSEEIVFDIGNTTSTPHQITKKSFVLYAEKASENGTFTNVLEQKNEHKSIFKLTLEDEHAEIAEFEVLDTDFILKLAANSPDTYLYHVCKPENSNQNFSDEIVTIKKGVAHKVDGKWMIKGDNKATIKFQ